MSHIHAPSAASAFFSAVEAVAFMGGTRAIGEGRTERTLRATPAGLVGATVRHSMLACILRFKKKGQVVTKAVLRRRRRIHAKLVEERMRALPCTHANDYSGSNQFQPSQ